MRRDEPRSPGTKRTIVKAIVTTSPSIVDLCAKGVKYRLELPTKDVRYSEVRDEFMIFVERRLDTFGGF